MEQLRRSQFAHFINTATSGSPVWTIEGIGVEALSIAMNPQIDTFKTILTDVADNTFNGYQMQSAVSGKRIYKGDPIYEYLDKARKEAKAIETQLLEVDMAYAEDNAYQSVRYDILIVIDEFLGENATISYTMYLKNPTQGTSTITNKVPSFSETTE